MEIYFIGLLVFIFGAILSLIVKSQKLKLIITSIFAFLGGLTTLVGALPVFFSDNNLEYVIHTNSIFQNIRFSIDPLSGFFIIFISIMSMLAVIYANGYLKNYIEKGKSVNSHCAFLTMLIVSMLLVTVSRNALFFLIAWELMSLSSFFLVLFEYEKKETLSAAVKYLVYMHVSVIFIILTFVVLSVNASSLDFNQFREVLLNNTNLANLVFILAFIGFGIKAGFVPFHNWLPDAHPAAPSHVSGIMSGVMIKTGIYGILRILSLIDVPSVQIGYFVLIISVISALYGVLYAISQHDIKRLLAYHSIENIGIIGIGIAVGMLGLTYNSPLVAILGFTGGILHILNHSIFKELLFLAAGAVYSKTHTRNIEVLGGLIKSMPKTAGLFLLASIAICGLPPLNGFISEFLIYFGMLNGLMINNVSVLIIMIFAIAGLALVGTMAILCFTKVFSIVFLGGAKTQTAKEVKEDVSPVFIIPMTVLALFILFIGLFPETVYNFMTKPVSVFVADIYCIELIGVLKTIALTSFTMIALAILLYIVKRKKNYKHVTWGCGYNKELPKAQYSASSYASPFLTMLKPLFKRVSDIKKPKTIFPKEAHYELNMEDIEEAYFVNPIVKSIEKFFSQFERIQNGNLQSYILYGLVFLLVSLIGVVLLG